MRINDSAPRQIVKNVDFNLVKGDRITMKVVDNKGDGTYQITIKGQSLLAKLPANLTAGLYRAEVISTEPFELQLIDNAEESSNPAFLKKGLMSDKFFLQLSKGTIDAALGEKVDISILKSLGGGSQLLQIKGNLFNINFGDILFKNMTATVTGLEPNIEMELDVPLGANLSSSLVKSLIGGFDITKILESMRNLKSLNMAELDAEKLKAALRNSGLFLENKLLNDESINGDEKFKSLLNGDKKNSYAMSRRQRANILLNDGLLGFIKAKDEKVDDALYRIKKDESGSHLFFLKMEFSNIGKTFIRMRPIGDTINIMIKSEIDISEDLKNIVLDNAFITWSPYQESDIDIFNIKDSVTNGLSNLDLKA